MIYRRVIPRAVRPALPVAAWASGAGAQSLAPPLLDSTAQLFAPVVGAGAVTLSAPAIASGATLYTPLVNQGSVTLAPPLIGSTVTLYAPTVGAGAVALAPPLIASTASMYAPAVGMGAVSLAPPVIASTATLYAPNVGTGAVNWNVQVGDGYTDVSPKQVVRTAGNVLYTIAPNCDSYPDFSANGLTQTIRVHKANSTGVPSGFTRKDSGNEPAAVVGCAAALDASGNIHIVWAARSSSSLTRYLRYAIFSTATDTWGSVTTIASDLDYDDIGQGDQSVALALDANDVCHVAYLGTAGSGTLTDRRVYYRNNAGGSWSSATQVDTGVTYSGNNKAWHPNITLDASGRRWVLWARGTFNGSGDTTIYSRVYSGGSWGSTVQASAETDAETGIDQSTSLLVTPGGRWHIAYILHSATNSQKYIRYRYSDDQGATWSGNNPASQATHNPALGWTGSKVRIYGHGTPDGGNHGDNLYYMEGDGGAGSWGTWTQIVTSTEYDCSVNVRWSQHNYWYPRTQDIAYWNQNYPNVLYVGTQVLALDIAAPLLASGATLYAPSAGSSAATLSPPVIGSSVTLYAPTLTRGALTLSAPLLSGGTALYAPTVSAVYSLGAPQIAGGATLSAPTVSAGGVSVTPPQIGSSAQVYSPSVSAGAVSLNAPLLASGAALYAPGVSALYALAAPLLAAGTQIYAPTVSGGGLTLAVPLLSSTLTLYAPTLGVGGVSVAPPRLGAGSVLYAPGVGATYALAAPLLTVTVQVYAPTVSGGTVTLGAPLLVSMVVLYAPMLTPGAVMLAVGVLGSTVQTYAPTVALGAAALAAPRLESEAVLYAPTVAGGAVVLYAPLLGSGAQLFAPWLILLGIVTPAARLLVVGSEQRIVIVAAERRVFRVEA